MYEGWTRLLIVYLTHPGVILPLPASSPIMQYLRGLWQAAWVMVLHSFSDGSKSYMAQMFYWIVFLAQVYVKVQIALVSKLGS